MAAPLLGALDERLGAMALVAALVVLWRGNPWPRGGKIAATAAAMALLGAVVPDQSRPATAAHPSAKDAKPAKTSPAFRPTPSASPTMPTERVRGFVGERLDTAFGRSRKSGYSVTYHDASSQGRAVTARSLWTVCFQRPEPGSTVVEKTVEFGAVRTGEPCPERDGQAVPWPKMPDVVGKTWPTARAEVVAVGVPERRVHAEAAYRNDVLPAEGEYDEWRVCRQDPAKDAELRNDTWVKLSLSSPENGCPDPDRGTAVYLPDRDGDGDPDYRDPHPGDRNRDTVFPNGRPRDTGGSSDGDSDRHGWSPCRHTRWC
ncbi:PASTA domain-containing protein [Streptomyces sp. NPDC090445]|uniref:PASTA domain-containing protein n=1 Tax=Streptomyces sp. NPDC090445 TaxID=3365963 RepID=UPI003812B28D